MIAVSNVNLLGDTLYSLKPLAELRMQRPDEEIVVGVGPGFAGDMVRAQFGRLLQIVAVEDLPQSRIELSAGVAAQIAVQALLRYGRRLHLSQCFAGLLGLDVGAWRGCFRPLMGWADGPFRISGLAHGLYVLLAPFSRSCSRHAGMRPNKTPDHDRWTLLVEWLRERGRWPRVLVGPGEQWTGCPVDTVSADSLPDLVRLLTGAESIITVDNGIGHVASALGCRVLILWPPVSSVDFIGPTWNPATTLLYMRPERVRADQLLDIIRKALS